MRYPIPLAIAVVAFTACNSSPTSPNAPSDAAAHAMQLTSLPAPAIAPYVARARPRKTFDLLSAPTAPGDVVAAVATLPAGWDVTGAPILDIDPATGKRTTFQIVAAKTIGRIYQVIARNTGSKPARLIADVPCSGCP